MNYHHKLMAIAMAASLVSTGAMALSKDEYKAQKDRISADYKLAKNNCDPLKSNAKDICVSEAKGIEKVARAELEAQYAPSEKATYKVGEARADATYDTAKEKCDDLAGNAKDVCVKDAKAAHVRTLAEAKVNKIAGEATAAQNQKVSDAVNDANKDINEANYKAARERCETFAGDVKSRCVSDLKVRFGKT
jgi:hypothetical protein